MALPAVSANDLLGRAEQNDRRARRWRKGKKHHGTFLVRLQDDDISVDRMDHAPDEDLASIQEEVAQKRGATSFYGWATIPVRVANRNGRKVRADPVEDLLFKNPYHAVIELPLSREGTRREEQKAHATELATAAVWRQNPKG